MHSSELPPAFPEAGFSSSNSRSRSRSKKHCANTSTTDLEAGDQSPAASDLSSPSVTAREPCHMPVPQFSWSPEDAAISKADEKREEASNKQQIRSQPMRLVLAPSKGRRQSPGSQPKEPSTAEFQQLPAHQKRGAGVAGHRWVPPVAYPPADEEAWCRSRLSPRSSSFVQSEPPDYVDVMLNGGFLGNLKTASTSIGGVSTQATASAVSEDELSLLPSPRSGVGSVNEHMEEEQREDVFAKARLFSPDPEKRSPIHEMGLLVVRLEEVETITAVIVTPAANPCTCVCR